MISTGGVDESFDQLHINNGRLAIITVEYYTLYAVCDHVTVQPI